MTDKPADAQPPPQGIVCPRCGCADLRVIRTEHRPGRVSRRRECRHCGRRITTTERTVGK